MGLVLDSDVLIAAERQAQPVSDLLLDIQRKHGETEVVISSITVIELEHGVHRANTPAVIRQRQAYVDTILLAIPAEPFTKEMGQLAAKTDVDARRTGLVIPREPADWRNRASRQLRNGHSEPPPLSHDSEADYYSTLNYR
jgi:tRNA(fMet)-specific endonuclease VapC